MSVLVSVSLYPKYTDLGVSLKAHFSTVSKEVAVEKIAGFDPNEYIANLAERSVSRSFIIAICTKLECSDSYRRKYALVSKKICPAKSLMPKCNIFLTKRANHSEKNLRSYADLKEKYN
jgi:hypothetical protein